MQTVSHDGLARSQSFDYGKMPEPKSPSEFTGGGLAVAGGGVADLGVGTGPRPSGVACPEEPPERGVCVTSWSCALSTRACVAWEDEALWAGGEAVLESS